MLLLLIFTFLNQGDLIFHHNLACCARYFKNVQHCFFAEENFTSIASDTLIQFIPRSLSMGQWNQLHPAVNLSQQHLMETWGWLCIESSRTKWEVKWILWYPLHLTRGFTCMSTMNLTARRQIHVSLIVFENKALGGN